jgi:integrase
MSDELGRLKQILESFQDTDSRNVLLIELALQTGARATELLNLQSSDLIGNDETVFIRGIKGSNDREIPLPAKLFARVKRFESRLEGPRLFDISYDRLYQIWGLYRPVPKKFHSLRHTFAIELYKRTRDIRLLQVALGHRNIANTMIYADYLYSKEELRRLLVEL